MIKRTAVALLIAAAATAGVIFTDTMNVQHERECVVGDIVVRDTSITCAVYWGE